MRFFFVALGFQNSMSYPSSLNFQWLPSHFQNSNGGPWAFQILLRNPLVLGFLFLFFSRLLLCLLCMFCFLWFLFLTLGTGSAMSSSSFFSSNFLSWTTYSSFFPLPLLFCCCFWFYSHSVGNGSLCSFSFSSCFPFFSVFVCFFLFIHIFLARTLITLQILIGRHPTSPLAVVILWPSLFNGCFSADCRSTTRDHHSTVNLGRLSALT